MNRRLLVAGVLLTAVVVVVALVVAGRATRSDVPDAAATSPARPTPAPARLVTGLVIGDSFTAGSPAGGQGDARWPLVLQRTLAEDGIRVDLRISGHSGGGNVARGTDTKTFADAARDDVRPTDDLVVVYGSTNDVLLPADDVEAGVGRTIDAVRARAPEARIVVVGASWATAQAMPAARRTVGATGRGARARDVTFVDPLTDGWFLGRNADLIDRRYDHPTDRGHVAFAKRMRTVLEPMVRRLATRPRPSSSPRPVRDAAPQRRLVSLLGGGRVARSYEGTCEDPGQFDVSVDQGRKFGRVTSPVVQVLGFVRSAERPAVIGREASCGPARQYTLGQGGAGWTSTSADALWFLDPDPRLVHAPGGSVPVGCRRVVALSVLDDQRARVGCGDGRVRGTMDGGETWTDLGSVEGLRTVAYRTPSVAVALASQRGCGAQVLTTRDGGRTWTQRSCIEGQRAEAMDVADGTWVALVDNFVVASTDDGRSWTLQRPRD